MPTKYLRKEMLQINENLRMYRYYYAKHQKIYLVPKNTADETIRIIVTYEDQTQKSKQFNLADWVKKKLS